MEMKLLLLLANSFGSAGDHCVAAVTAFQIFAALILDAHIAFGFAACLRFAC